MKNRYFSELGYEAFKGLKEEGNEVYLYHFESCYADGTERVSKDTYVTDPMTVIEKLDEAEDIYDSMGYTYEIHKFVDLAKENFKIVKELGVFEAKLVMDDGRVIYHCGWLKKLT